MNHIQVGLLYFAYVHLKTYEDISAVKSETPEGQVLGTAPSRESGLRTYLILPSFSPNGRPLHTPSGTHNHPFDIHPFATYTPRISLFTVVTRYVAARLRHYKHYADFFRKKRFICNNQSTTVSIKYTLHRNNNKFVPRLMARCHKHCHLNLFLL